MAVERDLMWENRGDLLSGEGETYSLDFSRIGDKSAEVSLASIESPVDRSYARWPFSVLNRIAPFPSLSSPSISMNFERERRVTAS